MVPPAAAPAAPPRLSSVAEEKDDEGEEERAKAVKPKNSLVPQIKCSLAGSINGAR